jgi:hypothetical protein
MVARSVDGGRRRAIECRLRDGRARACGPFADGERALVRDWTDEERDSPLRRGPWFRAETPS